MIDSTPDPTIEESNRLKVAAGVTALLVGPLGIHKFILGCTGTGIAMLLISVLSLGLLAPLMGLIGIIEGVIYLTRSDDVFRRDYVLNKRSWF